MKVILLGNNKNKYCDMLKEYLLSQGESLLFFGDKIPLDVVQKFSPDIIVSYNYRFLISKEILTFPKFGAINLHVSFLPWNRGADPNLWSFMNDTPKGVTIHYIDEGLDTGDIIAQKEVDFSTTDTLQTSYGRLHEEIQFLFKEQWSKIRIGQCDRTRQDKDKGSFHLARDKKQIEYILSEGWDTPITVLQKYTAQSKESNRMQQ